MKDLVASKLLQNVRKLLNNAKGKLKFTKELVHLKARSKSTFKNASASADLEQEETKANAKQLFSNASRKLKPKRSKVVLKLMSNNS